MTVENELEILADKPTDISGRLITKDNLKRFKGLPAQTVYDKEDNYRPYIMDGENFGGKPLMFKDEFIDTNGIFRVSSIESSKNNDILNLDVNTYSNFQINLLHPEVSVKFNDITSTEVNIAQKITLFLKFTTGSNHLLLPDNLFLDDSIYKDQLSFAETIRNNKAGDMAAFECFTLDSGALWFGRLLGYWSK